MPTCTSSWQLYGCECGIPCFWQSMGLLRRLDVIVLALMLARVILVVAGAAYRYRSIQRSPATDTQSQEFQRGRKMFAADLTLRLHTLGWIAETAPFFGLAGSCVGIFDSFTGIGMQKETALAILSLNLGRAPITTAAALLVTIPAICSYNYLRTRLELLQVEISGTAPKQSVSENDALASPKVSRSRNNSRVSRHLQ
jgi:uncharacterized membrane protein YfcA